MIRGAVLYGVEDSGHVGLVSEDRTVALRHLEGVQADVRARCQLLTLQVLSVEPGCRDARAEMTTMPPGAGNEEVTQVVTP